uniref:GH14214p n=1 Tax=Drosophila melanogaster TaxID=7227 RepID=A2VED9_DROME|nr:GH14214p [Drosophila melanogaster]
MGTLEKAAVCDPSHPGNPLPPGVHLDPENLHIVVHYVRLQGVEVVGDSRQLETDFNDICRAKEHTIACLGIVLVAKISCMLVVL